MNVSLMSSIILNTDSYKTSHYLQLPPGTTYLSSYIESRGGKFDEVVFFGLQAFLKAYMSSPITIADIDEAEEIITAHGMPFNRAGWEAIVERHDGYLPIEISAIPEGTTLKTKNVMVQLINTDPEMPWLTSYVETALLRAIWYPSTVATLSREAKKLIADAVEKTGEDVTSTYMKMQDFGARGVSSYESAGIGGMAHLVNFKGSDTLTGVLFAKRLYGAPMAGFSIPASEHSTISSWGRGQEKEAYQNMLDQFLDKDKLVAVVSDTWDLFRAIDKIWGEDLIDRIKKSGGTVVVRPDSGEPVFVVKETIRRLMLKYGYTVNDKGYKVLPSCIRVIQGDGINLDSLKEILDALEEAGYSVDNVGFGMGGGLLQQLDRDTQKFAMKASAVLRDAMWFDVYKDPKTDPGKTSKKGVLSLVKNDGELITVRRSDLGSRTDLLRPVFRNGRILIETSFEEVRERAEIPILKEAMERAA